MTNAYVRIKRDGSFQSIEFDQLTDVELDEFESRPGRDAELKSQEGWKWAKFLAKWIRENIREGA